MAVNSVSIGSYRQRHTVIPALGLALLIVVVEYLARHFVALWLPALGQRRVNELLIVGVGYGAMVWLSLSHDQHVGAFGRVVRSILAQARRWQVWAGALAALVVTMGLMAADTALWSTAQLPMLVSPWQSSITVLGASATTLTIVAVVLVNAIIVPFAEEWLWRGLIQPRLAASWSLGPALITTAVLFSLKHVLVDASLSKLLAVTGFGLVMGVIGARYGWRAAALAHAITNAIATILMLLATGSV